MGRGMITEKKNSQEARQGNVAKLMGVEFESGQSCLFHSRVKDNYEVVESFGKELDKIITSEAGRGDSAKQPSG